MKYLFALMSLCGVLCMPAKAAWVYKADTEPELKDSDANMVGHVVDKKTQEHVIGISVMLKGTTIGTSTQNNGHYSLWNLPEGTFTIVVSGAGYQTVTREVKLKKGVMLEENFEVEEDLISLDGVVVSANRNKTSRRTAPSLINVIGFKTFEDTNSPTLAEGLNFQPGVRVENNCQNCGFQQVRINGMEGPYTQILIDSRPVFSALSGVYGLEQIPANMVERIEVMRGGGSALFGSSAIAGTVNVITKEPIRNTGQVSHTITGIDGFSKFDNNTSLNASLVTDDHKAGLYVFGQNRNRSSFDYDGDGFTELPELKSQIIGLRSFLKTSDYSKLSFEYHHVTEFRRGGDSLELPPHQANICEQTDHSINGGGLNFDYFSPNEKHRVSVYASTQSIDRDSYYGGGQDMKAYGHTDGITFIAGSQYNYMFDRLWFMPSELTAGAEYTYDKIKDNMWGYGRYMNQKVHIESAFLQNEWKNEMWSFLVGGRLDKHNMISGAIFSPRANVRFNPMKNLNFRLTYSSGFRAPQAFDEDLHIENVGGTVSMTELDPDLKEERSNSFSASMDWYHRWGSWQLNFMLEGFYSKLSDAFHLEEKGYTADSVRIYRRVNTSGAKVMGLTMEGKIAFRSMWQLQMGLTLQKSRYDEYQDWSEGKAPKEKKMFRSPDTYGYFTASYTPVKPLTIALSGTYTGSMLVPLRGANTAKLNHTSDFFDCTVKVGYDFQIYKAVTLQLNGGVQNIFNAYQKDFDQGSDRDSGYIYGPMLPRSYFAGIKINY